MAGWYKPGNVLGVIAGEPTLSRFFTQYCEIFREEWNPGQDVNFVQPIADMNRFAHERLFDRSNGRGLWTAFGPKFQDRAEQIYSTFSHWNANDHSAGGCHQANLIDRKTLCDALGISDEEWIRYRDNCWVANTWSPSITPHGAYFCEHAAQLDILFNEGKRAWPIEPGWWKRTPAEFGDQLDICEMCSLALPAPAILDSDEKDIVSAPNRRRLELINSPAIKRGRLIDYDPAVHTEKRVIASKDNYIAASGVRVARDNKYVYGKRIALVLACVNRSPALARTLPRNAPLADEVVVVTTTADADTQEVVTAVAQLHPHVRLVLSDRCYENGDAFNKGKMLNDGLRALTRPDWVVLTDCDVFLHGGFREWCRTHALNPGVLHGCHRLDIEEADVPAFVAGKEVRAAHAGGVNAEPNGYFQMFNRRASAVRDRWPAVLAETFCSAGGVDSWLMSQFEVGKRVMVPNLPVFHVKHDSAWNGTGDDAAPRWRQMGMLVNHQGQLGLVPTGPAPVAPARLRLTDTLRGESVEVDAGGDLSAVVRPVEGGLEFNGKPLGGAHVHLAYHG